MSRGAKKISEESRKGDEQLMSEFSLLSYINLGHRALVLTLQRRSVGGS